LVRSYRFAAEQKKAIAFVFVELAIAQQPSL
jgi:hypothetical protein